MNQTGFIMVSVNAATGVASVTVKHGRAPFRPAPHLVPRCPLFGDGEDQGRVVRASRPPILCVTEAGEVHDPASRTPWDIVVENPRPGIWSTRFADPDRPDGKLHLRLERRLESELEIVQAGFDLPPGEAALFSDREMTGYQDIHARECAQAGTASTRRADLRGHSVLTIDNDDTRDIDDAIEIKEVRPGRQYILGIHIADVTAFIEAGSPRDRDARNRSTSHYFGDTVLHMLPQCLSADLCSLVPNEDRLAVSLYLEIMIREGRAEIRGSRITPSVIRSGHRLTYTEVNGLLQDRPADELGRALHQAQNLATALFANRPGGSDQDNDHGPSGALIEHFMVEANHFVGRHMAQTLAALRGGPRAVLFRGHPGPSQTDLLDYARRLLRAGLLPQTDAEELLAAAHDRQARDFEPAPSPKEEDAMFRSALHKEIQSRVRAGTAEELALLASLGAQPGKQGIHRAANLTTQPDWSGHHALGLSRYAWFTSPIRRYPDMVNHRFLKEAAGALSLDDVQAIHRRIANGRHAQRLFQERMDFAELVRGKVIAEGKTMDLAVLNFRFASPYVFVVRVRVADREVSVRVRDCHHATINEDAFECHLVPPGKPPIRLWPGMTARLHVHAGDASVPAGCLLVNTDQWSLVGGA